DEDTRLVHFIGKDNIVFHCLIFPAMLMAHGEFVLPDNVPANEFLNLEGNKLSTSRNYAVWLDDYLQKFDPDSLRYVLASNLPETRDTDFSWRDFQARHNNELADILGNFVNRTVTFAHKYFGGKVPAAGQTDALDKELLERLEKAPEQLGKLIDTFQLKNYVREVMDLARFANKYFNDKEPWKTRKSDMDSCATTIHYCLQTVGALSVLLEPVLPFTSRKIWNMLGLGETHRWDEFIRPVLKEGAPVGQPEILFTKIEDKIIERETNYLQAQLNGGQKADEEEENAPEIDIETFAKIDLRVAEIVEAEKVKKSDKLVKLQIKIGDEQRQIVAGIAQHYQPEKLVGRKIIVVANLKPAKLFGETSQGMLLAAKNGDKLALLSVPEDMPSGSKIS
ncbi:MAG TPA: methionine--tRNA ligase subunit beta, partial [Caldithrix abyssi]|nr:methionine--tRNA ligase subunit beta [Caldithrix abyssi]